MSAAPLQQLTGLDTMFLTQEEPRTPMHIGMLMLYRVYMIAYSLTGSYFVLRGDVRMHPEREEKASEPSGIAGEQQAGQSEQPVT